MTSSSWFAAKKFQKQNFKTKIARRNSPARTPKKVAKSENQKSMHYTIETPYLP
jgi:hypothetical protein